MEVLFKDLLGVAGAIVSCVFDDSYRNGDESYDFIHNGVELALSAHQFVHLLFDFFSFCHVSLRHLPFRGHLDSSGVDQVALKCCKIFGKIRDVKEGLWSVLEFCMT